MQKLSVPALATASPASSSSREAAGVDDRGDPAGHAVAHELGQNRAHGQGGTTCR
jgi:hypothetical protein